MNIKSFGKNAAIYSIGTIALRFTSFLLIPLYTHYLTQEEFGLLQTLLFTIQIIITFNDVGMRSALMRFFTTYDNNNKTGELLGSSFFIILFTGILFLIISLIIPDKTIADFFHIKVISKIIFYTVLVGVTQTLSLNILSYFRARNEGLYYMYISFGTAILLIASISIALIFFDLGIMGVLYAQAFTFAISWLAVLLFILFKHGLTIRISTLKTLFKFGFPLIFAMSGDLILYTSGNYFLGHFTNLEQVGLFALALKIAQISIMVLIGPFQMAYEPFVFSHQDDKDIAITISKIVTYVTIVFIIVSYGILYVFRDMIYLIGDKQYYPAYYLIFLILPGMGFTLLNYVGQSLLHMNNKTQITGKIVLVSTIISLIVTFFLTKYFGIYGLIFGINFYLIGSSVALFYFGYKEFSVNLEYGKLLIISIIGFFLFIIIYFLSFYSRIIYYTILALLPIIVLLLLYKSKFFTDDEKEKLWSSIITIKKKFQ